VPLGTFGTVSELPLTGSDATTAPPGTTAASTEEPAPAHVSVTVLPSTLAVNPDGACA
jgi:hypothetical protein